MMVVAGREYSRAMTVAADSRQPLLLRQTVTFRVGTCRRQHYTHPHPPPPRASMLALLCLATTARFGCCRLCCRNHPAPQHTSTLAGYVVDTLLVVNRRNGTKPDRPMVLQHSSLGRGGPMSAAPCGKITDVPTICRIVRRHSGAPHGTVTGASRFHG